MELPVWWLLLVSLLSPAFSSLRAADRCVLVALPTAAATIMAPAFFPYHFPPLLALSSLAFALTTFYLRPQFRAMKWIAGGGLIVLTAAAIALTGPAQIRNRLLHPEHPAVARIVREIERTTSPDDAIFAFPFDSVYNLKADRPAPGAYGWVSPWVLPPDKLKKFLAEFAQRPPALVLYVYFDKCTTNGARPKDYLEPLLARLLKDYRIREIYPNNVVMLERLAPGEETAPGERCLLEKLLYTDLDCRGVVPPLAQWRRECEL